mmetsp:Transcript_95679/g.205290  ORF Transcript_95679/g.205290 Transcript_95679/m.205290 type:complete len:444 (-) Transcript_95679:56-1387(-)
MVHSHGANPSADAELLVEHSVFARNRSKWERRNNRRRSRQAHARSRERNERLAAEKAWREALKVGDTVVLSGLSENLLNGEDARLEAWDIDEQRWSVRVLSTRQLKVVCPESLVKGTEKAPPSPRVASAEEQRAATQSSTPVGAEEAQRLSVRELRRLLEERGIKVPPGTFEKSELVALLETPGPASSLETEEARPQAPDERNAEPAPSVLRPPASAGESPTATLGQQGADAHTKVQTQPAAWPDWLPLPSDQDVMQMSVAELLRVLRNMQVFSAGLREKTELRVCVLDNLEQLRARGAGAVSADFAPVAAPSPAASRAAASHWGGSSRRRGEDDTDSEEEAKAREEAKKLLASMPISSRYSKATMQVKDGFEAQRRRQAEAQRRMQEERRMRQRGPEGEEELPPLEPELSPEEIAAMPGCTKAEEADLEDDVESLKSFDSHE